jgi:hypothetical protein
MIKVSLINNFSKEALIALADSSNSLNALCIKVGYASSNTKNRNFVKEKLIEYNYDFNRFKNRENSVFNEEKKLKHIVAESFTFQDVLKKYELKYTGGNQKSLKKYIKKFSIDITHFNPQNYILSKENFNQKWTNEEIFISNSLVSTTIAKKRIIQENLIEYKCSCGLGCEWNNKPITLQLEHKNGNNKDHRLENLEFLCPNCHSQTLTYGSRNNKGKKPKVIKSLPILPAIQRDLENLIKNITSYKKLEEILIKYKAKVSDNNRYTLNRMLLKSKDDNVLLFLEKAADSVRKQIIFPAPEIVLDMVNKANYVKVAKVLNCSDNSVRNYLRLNKLI